MRRHTIVAAAVALTLVTGAAACGGSGSANGTTGTATATTQNGTTSAGGTAAGHSFSVQVQSLSQILDQATALSASHGSSQVAATIGQIRRGLSRVRYRLGTASVPSALQTQTHQLVGFLDEWNRDLAHAQRTAQDGRTSQAIQQVRTATYSELKTVADTIRAAMG